MTGRYDESRYWKVVKDPSNLFTGNLFRLIDLKAGGFDCGTVFEHIRTGERRTTGLNGIARKDEQPKKNSTTIRRPTRPAIRRANNAQSAMRPTRNPHRRLPA